MKKRMAACCLAAAMCLTMTGCKSTDYKKGVELQDKGEYEAALEEFQKNPDYKDSGDHIKSCQTIVDAVNSLKEKNDEVDEDISKAQTLIDEGKKALDDTLVPALETAISEMKAAKVEVPDMTEGIDDIEAKAKELNDVDYTEKKGKLESAYESLDKSVKQYDLLNAPSEERVIKCLGNVANIKDISAVTEDNDPNGKLNKQGGYTAQIYFSSDLVDQGSISGSSVIEKGTECGGSVEVYANEDDAKKRDEYLGAFDGTMFASGSHTVKGTVVIRTSQKLKASQQKEMEANIINALTADE